MTPKQWSDTLSLLVGAAIAGLGAILALAPDALGLDPVVVRWLGVVNVILGFLATQTKQMSLGRKQEGRRATDQANDRDAIHGPVRRR